MIKRFEKHQFDSLRREVESALLSVAQKHGIKVSTGKLTYMRDGSSVTIAVELATIGTGGVALTRSVTDFKASCSMYGLKPEHLGATFSYMGEKYRLDGMAGGKSWKYVFAATRLADGKQYRVPEGFVRELQDPAHKDKKNLFASAPTMGTCANESAYDEKFNPIGQCTRPAVTRRKEGFGRRGVMKSYCQQCADLMDESRREAEAEARMS